MTNQRLYDVLRGFQIDGAEIEGPSFKTYKGYFVFDRWMIEFQFDTEIITNTAITGGTIYYPTETAYDNEYVSKVESWKMEDEDGPARLNAYQRNLVTNWINQQVKGLEYDVD